MEVQPGMPVQRLIEDARELAMHIERHVPRRSREMQALLDRVKASVTTRRRKAKVP